ncbi:MAG: MarR family transcriptional regulator [Syntrophales bacterium]|nr:MarR family transcriptional regulator [Syntrophales bacterium]MCK9528348.1 MarR family transcriptional regulator [Syntrophales bacterium]MDX9922727.1 MarR family transcriptional regulator [Syntrophales bacterium]
MNDDDRLILLLFTAQQKLRSYLNNALAASDIGVTVAQSGILFLLKQKEGRTMTEISRILGIDNSTVTGLTDRLEKAGLVRRQNNPNDRRISHLQITEKGLREADRARVVIHRVNDEIKSGHTDEEIDSFKRVLKRFFAKFDGSKKAVEAEASSEKLSTREERFEGAGR